MAAKTELLDHPPYDLSSDAIWRELYPSLRSFTRRYVYALRVSAWVGQEEDIVEDAVQETIRRLIEWAQRAKGGEVLPIYSLKSLMKVIVCNYCKDLRRRDRRLVHSAAGDWTLEVQDAQDDQHSFAEVAIEHMYRESVFLEAARQIAKFPKKQRRALLVDLANLMHFDAQPTALQKGFMAVGIRLQDYQQPLPADPRERARYRSLVILAYKRIGKLSLGSEGDEDERKMLGL